MIVANTTKYLITFKIDIMNIAIEQKARITIIEHAVQDYPNECVGFFYGHDEGDVRTITAALPIINSKEGDQRRRFEVHPKDYLTAERYALTHDLTLLGVYHSHPDHPAIPSVHDLAQAMPFFSYIIVGVNKGVARSFTSWLLDEQQQFKQEIISII
jgi:proteasome lid subunit RPN8/RPN11